MRLIPPQRLRPHYYEGVEQALRDFFIDFLFKPLAAVLPAAQASLVFANTAEGQVSRALLDAVRRGAVQYNLGVVTGQFDAATSSALRALGAEFDTRANAFRLPEWLAPGWFKAETTAARVRAENVHQALARELDRVQNKLAAGQDFAPIIDASMPIEAIEEGFETAADALGIVKRIPPAARRAMEARYAENVRPYVAAATAEYIDGVHKAIVDNAARGYRYESIVADLQYFVGVSERKAKFIARQETALFMAGYRQERFTEAGVTRYKWSTSHDIRVRPYADEKGLKKYGDHRVLDKQIFFYSLKAPAQYMSSKKPCNPGEDFGCRCVDIAVLE